MGTPSPSHFIDVDDAEDAVGRSCIVDHQVERSHLASGAHQEEPDDEVRRAGATTPARVVAIVVAVFAQDIKEGVEPDPLLTGEVLPTGEVRSEAAVNILDGVGHGNLIRSREPSGLRGW